MSATHLETNNRFATRLGLVLFGVATGITILIFSTVLFARAAPPPLYTPPEALMPGQPLPDGVQCVWPPYNEKIVHCHVTLEHDVYLIYDATRGLITSTSVAIDDQASVGVLMLSWGTPTGQRRYTWSTQVQWGSRYVYVSSHPFSPASMPYFVHYTLEPETVRPWIGFINRQ